MKNGLSVVIPVKNEEKNLKELLPTLIDWVDEIIVVDDHSTDNTVNYCRKFEKVKVFENIYFNNHGSTNYGIDKANYSWILHIDADERIMSQLKDEILHTINNPGNFVAFQFKFLGYIGKTKVTSCGWWPNYVTRLIKNGMGHHIQIVHHEMNVKGKVGKLNNPVIHYSYTNIDHYLKKFNLYTTWYAKNILEGNVSRWYIFSRILFKFPYKYFMQKGFLDGIYGFLIAFLDPIYYLIAYLKYIEMKQKKVKRLKSSKVEGKKMKNEE